MTLIFHIFWKDTRRLWKEIAVTLLLLAYLTRLDSWRAGYTAGSPEGWLNILLPLAWSYLAALCVLQDPLPGERQFWLTLPQPRTTLFAAKALFAIAFIHIPYFLSSVMILAARDFNPVQCLPHLLAKQLFLLIVLTLPSLALAAVAKNTTQYVLLALTIGGAAILAAGDGSLAAISMGPIQWQYLDRARSGLVLLLLALSSVLVLWLQYKNRLTSLSRAAGTAGLVTAAAIYLWLPLRSSASLDAALRPVPERYPARGSAIVRLQLGAQKPAPLGYASSGIQIIIPLEITGLAGRGTHRLQQLDLEIDGPAGARVHAQDLRPYGYFPGGAPPRGPSLIAFIDWSDAEHTRLHLNLDRITYDLLARTPATLIGHFTATTFSQGTKTSLHGRTDVPSVGHCLESASSGGLFQHETLKVMCELPDDFPTTRVFLTDLTSNRHWESAMGTTTTLLSYPANTWLSPMSRRDAFFSLTPADGPGQQWTVPQSALPNHKVEIQPWREIATEVVGYELKDIQLSTFLLNAAR